MVEEFDDSPNDQLNTSFPYKNILLIIQLSSSFSPIHHDQPSVPSLIS